jgi:glutamyl-tRNA synthetase
LEADGGEIFWNSIRGNLSKVADAQQWYSVVYGDLEANTNEVDREFVELAANLLPEEPWDENTWKIWTDKVKKATGRTGKCLFMPLRLVLTGFPHGPELATLLPLIGYERGHNRLRVKREHGSQGG